eukprot:gene51036-57215_t
MIAAATNAGAFLLIASHNEWGESALWAGFVLLPIGGSSTLFDASSCVFLIAHAALVHSGAPLRPLLLCAALFTLCFFAALAACWTAVGGGASYEEEEEQPLLSPDPASPALGLLQRRRSTLSALTQGSGLRAASAIDALALAEEQG